MYIAIEKGFKSPTTLLQFHEATTLNCSMDLHRS